MHVPLQGTWTYTLARDGRPVIRFNGRLVRFSFFDPRRGGATIHFGCDIDGATGDAVLAMLAGTFVGKGWEPSGFGHYTVVEDTAGTFWFDAHMRAASRRSVGATLREGAKLGECGDTGYSDGDHTHLERRRRRYDRSTCVDTYCAIVWAVEQLHDRAHRNPYHRPTPEASAGLTIGHRGEGVMWLQWALRVPLRGIDGRFTTALEKRLRAFQQRRFGYSTGRVGPKTYAALKAVMR